MLDVFKDKKNKRYVDMDYDMYSDSHIHSVPNITKSNYSRIKDFGDLVELILTDVNTSASVLFNTIFVAILNGDIVVDRSFNNSKLMTAKTTEDPNALLLTLKDKEGNIINKTKMDDNLINLFWGMKFN